jgi:hypothetical protein
MPFHSTSSLQDHHPLYSSFKATHYRQIRRHVQRVPTAEIQHMAHELVPTSGGDDFRLDGLRVRPRGIHRAVGTCRLFQHRFERQIRVAHGLMLVVWYADIVV